MNDWITICRVDDIPVLGARRVRRPAGTDVAVFRTESGRVFALLDRCPHKGGPLSQGIVFGEHVACPLHNWAIALEDGQARAPDVGCATRFSVRVDDGVVSLLAGELASLAIDDALDAAVDPATARRMTGESGSPMAAASANPPANERSAAVAASENRPANEPSSCAQSQDPCGHRTITIVSA